MSPAPGTREVMVIRWWRRLWSQLMALVSGRRARLPRLLVSSKGARLSDELHDQYKPFESQKGLVGDTVREAVRDYLHLRDVVAGPGATADAVDDVSLVADAEEALREILARAPELQILVELAGKRSNDRQGREATGEAMLQFCDRGRDLHQLASAALRWASSRSEEDLAQMRICAKQISS